MRDKNLKNTVLSAMFLAIGIILPFFTSHIKEIGDTLLPMHIPAMLCGFICGPWYGLAVGFLIPVLKSVISSMPPIYPNAVWMALELATYGFVTGFLYRLKKKPSMLYTYICLITAMLAGRIVWGVAKAVLLSIGGKAFGISAFVAGGFVDAIPGIIIQLVLIPVLLKVLDKNEVAKYD